MGCQNPMRGSGGDQQIISRNQSDSFTIHLQQGLAVKQQHPFILFLEVENRLRLGTAEDALNTHGTLAPEIIEGLTSGQVLQISVKISRDFHANHHEWARHNLEDERLPWRVSR